MSSDPAASPAPPRGHLKAVLARPGVAMALVAVALFLLLRGLDPAPLAALRNFGFDTWARLAPRGYEATPVVIVAIDEASLKPPYGQWPWPRTLVARLIDKIAAGGARALAVDILFSEPDRASPDRVATIVPGLPPALKAALDALPRNDDVLAKAFGKIPTVLGVGVTYEAPTGSAGRFAVPPVRTSGNPQRFLVHFPALVRSLPDLTVAARGPGALAVDPGGTGIIRRVPLFINVGGNIIPALAIETLAVALGGAPVLIHAAGDGIEGAQVGSYVLPTDRRGRAYPSFAHAGSVTTISASDILDGSFDAKRLAGDVVFLGVTGLGLVDVKATPLGLMQGIEIHAQLLQSILLGDLLRRPEWVAWIELAMVFAAGLIVVFGLSYDNPVLVSAAAGGIVALYVAGGFAAFRFGHLLLDGTYPALASVATFGIMLTANLRQAQADRRRLRAELEREHEAKLRLAAELDAARAIQLGLLPRRLGDMPGLERVELHALIESARMVGGDLYDFMMLDDAHLFIAIADVSGKGIAAALFMAMTKEVLHQATLRHGTALGGVFAEANRDILARGADAESEGARPTFVTVFAAILDLVTGDILYVSAGHDSPYIVRPDGTWFRLETAGGPPLGCLEDEVFPVDRGRLAPGDVLLLYTDGVTEAKNAANAFYSSARLEALVGAGSAPTAKSLVERVRADVGRFVGDAEQADDITILGVRWLGPAGA